MIAALREPAALASISLQQPLDVIELDLRAVAVAEAAAPFFEDAADALHGDFAGDFHRQIVELAAMQRAAERIAVAAGTLLAAGAIARAVVLAVAVARLH